MDKNNQTIPFPFCSICGTQMKDNLKSTMILHKKIDHPKELKKIRLKKRINIAIVFGFIAFMVGSFTFIHIESNSHSTPADMKCYDMGFAIDGKISDHTFSGLDTDIEKMSEKCRNVVVVFSHGIDGQDKSGPVKP